MTVGWKRCRSVPRKRSRSKPDKTPMIEWLNRLRKAGGTPVTVGEVCWFITQTPIPTPEVPPFWLRLCRAVSLHVCAFALVLLAISASQLPALAVLGADVAVGLGKVRDLKVGGIPLDQAVHAFGNVAQQAQFGQRAGVVETRIGGASRFDGAHPFHFVAIRHPGEGLGWALVFQVPAQRQQLGRLRIDAAHD